MFNLKSIYFYFLAIQISLIKLLRKLYFTTNIYNKSLVSRTPQQFFFHPNPFLLSTITSYKDYSFKLSEIDPNSFWIKPKNIREQKELHNFLWLNLIDRKNDGKSIQKVINLWMLKYSKYKKNIWETSVLSKRIISWILNSDIILNNGLFEFKRNFFTTLILQANHLKKNIQFEKDYSKKLEILTALLLTGLVFKEYEEYYKISIKELEKLIKDFFDENGFPVSRNPSDLIFFFKYLSLCKECIKDAQKYIPECLEEIINQNIDCITKILSQYNQIPHYKGGLEENLHNINKFFNKNIPKSKNKKEIKGGIGKLKFRESLIFFDVGEPPKKDFSSSYQSGPLSFEYFFDGMKIITNCGFGKQISSKARLLSRLTSAQSTLTLNDTSVTKFERNKIVNQVYGDSIKNTFKILDYEFKEDKNLVEMTASHNGYEKNFNCIFKRKILIEKSSKNLIGTDEIIKRKDGKPVNYSLRFHLYPGLTAVKTIGGDSILIQISKNKSLIFTIKGEKILLENSIFFGGNKILEHTCVTVSGNLVNENKVINWEIKRNF